MNQNDINNKFADYEARIAKLEKQIQDYYAEKRDHTNRNDMAADGHIDNLGTVTREQAIQHVKSFYQSHDKQIRDNIEQMRHGDTNDARVVKYDAELAVVKELQRKFNL